MGRARISKSMTIVHGTYRLRSRKGTNIRCKNHIDNLRDSILEKLELFNDIIISQQQAYNSLCVSQTQANSCDTLIQIFLTPEDGLVQIPGDQPNAVYILKDDGTNQITRVKFPTINEIGDYNNFGIRLLNASQKPVVISPQNDEVIQLPGGSPYPNCRPFMMQSWKFLSWLFVKEPDVSGRYIMLDYLGDFDIQSPLLEGNIHLIDSNCSALYKIDKSSKVILNSDAEIVSFINTNYSSPPIVSGIMITASGDEQLYCPYTVGLSSGFRKSVALQVNNSMTLVKVGNNWIEVKSFNKCAFILHASLSRINHMLTNIPRGAIYVCNDADIENRTINLPSSPNLQADYVFINNTDRLLMIKAPLGIEMYPGLVSYGGVCPSTPTQPASTVLYVNMSITIKLLNGAYYILS